MKKYSLEIKLTLVLIIVLYVFPIYLYLTNNYEINNLGNILFILYPFTFFICSMIESKYKGNFYIYPIGSTILFIPLAFTIYNSNYLPCFFLYLIFSLLGGLFGYWLHSHNDAYKSFKQALGISCIIGSIFSLIALLLKYRFYYCYNSICNREDVINFPNLKILIIIIGVVLMGRHCLKERKVK